jgi:hypothetical protein
MTSPGKPAPLSIPEVLKSSDHEVKRGLMIVVITQIAQQFSGINAGSEFFLYFFFPLRQFI